MPADIQPQYLEPSALRKQFASPHMIGARLNFQPAEVSTVLSFRTYNLLSLTMIYLIPLT